MKALLKKIFPILWLRNAALWVNTLKIKTLDRFLYAEYIPEAKEILLYEKKNPFLDANIDISMFTPDIREGFARWQDPAWTQDQYIVEIEDKPVSIDPQRGWGIVGKNQLIYFSLGFAHAPYVRKPTLRGRASGKKVVLPKVISLRDTGEENYFHAYNDVLAKLLLLRDHARLDASASILVTKAFWDKPYFQTLKNNCWFKDLNWYVQTNEWIETQHVIFCKPYTHTKKYLQELAAIMKPTAGGNDRIMLTRSRSSLRFIENEEQVFQILARYGFTKLDTSGMSLQQQVETFSRASHVVAIHGAGITNIIYRQDALHVLELFHHNAYLPFHYIMLARTFGFDYAAVRGQKGQHAAVGGFYIDPNEVEAYCKSVFKNA
jgi:hypothetical protein